MFDFKLNQFQKFLFANSTICYLDKYPCLAFHSLPFKCSRYKGTTPHWLYCRKLFRLQSSLQIILNKSNLHFERQRKSPFTYISHTIYLQKPDVRNWLVCTTTTNTLNMKLLSEPIYVKPSTNWVTHANSCFQQFLMRSIYPPNKLFSKLFLAPTSIQTTTVREAFITPINS